MKYIKKDSCETIEDVIERNTGMDIQQFMEDSENEDIPNLKEAAAFIKEHSDIPCKIVGDYDSDGVNATSILFRGLKMLGIHADTRIPRRFTEGYGLSEKIIDEIEAPGLVITVDNGITALSAIAKAKEKGLFVIITDHHLPIRSDDGREVLPDADIIVDPHLESNSNFQDYCGAAIAYRLVRELVPDKDLVNLLILASIATVSDVVPMKGYNHTLVKKGLEALNKGYGVPGLKEIMKKQKITHFDESDFGFRIGPILNATGRLSDKGSELALEVLIAGHNDPGLITEVRRLVRVNDRRKEYAKDQTEIAKEMVTERPIVIYDPFFSEGIVGIIAGRLAEEFHCPAIVLTDGPNGTLKGSARSIPEIHLKNTLDKISDEMLGYGGHAGAAGLSISADKFEDFKNAFINAVGNVPDIPDTIYYDLEADKEDVCQIIETLNRYALYGEGNSRPTFHVMFDLKDMIFTVMGDGSHFQFKEKKPSKIPFNIVGFGLTDRLNEQRKERPFTKIECIGTFRESYFMDKKRNVFEITDFKPVYDPCIS